MAFQTEYDFTLPFGFVDEDGNTHKEGKMRLATAGDEILPQKDSRVQNNLAYLTVILLSRVTVKLGEFNNTDITPDIVENLFTADMAYLQDFYQRINGNGTSNIIATCPKCSHQFELEETRPGE